MGSKREIIPGAALRRQPRCVILHLQQGISPEVGMGSKVSSRFGELRTKTTPFLVGILTTVEKALSKLPQERSETAFRDGIVPDDMLADGRITDGAYKDDFNRGPFRLTCIIA